MCQHVSSAKPVLSCRGLALTPEEHLIAVQKSIQANFVLSLQSFFRCQSGWAFKFDSAAPAVLLDLGC